MGMGLGIHTIDVQVSFNG